MLTKRIIGVVTVKGDHAVQSIGFKKYLPIGKPEIVSENLDRWGADEILIQCIDRSQSNLGPNFAFIERIGKLGLRTPITYAGGIRSAADGVRVVKSGIERVALDSAFHQHPENIQLISEALGAQALIASLPLSVQDGKLEWLNHVTKVQKPLDQFFRQQLHARALSEALVIDWKNEGKPNGFDFSIVDQFAKIGTPMILFGGISQPAQIRRAFLNPLVSAVAIGNFLNYREHSIWHLKRELDDLQIRLHDTRDSEWTS